MDSRAKNSAKAPPSRLRLYLPFGLLFLVVAAWSVGWLAVRHRVLTETAAWRAGELAQGREWSCPGERVGGFPFRVELRCDNPSLTWGPPDARITGTVAGLTVITQVYQLRRAIVDAQGPLAVRLPDGGGIDGSWQTLRASIGGTPQRLERLSVVARQPSWTVTAADGLRDEVSADAVELQARPDPQRFAEDETADLALTVSQAALPLVDALTGDEARTDLSLILRANHVSALLASNPIAAAETWRARGGVLDIAPLTITKGGRRLEARGTLALDEERRPAGQIDLAAQGLDSLIERLTGQNERTTALIMGGLSLLGGRAPAANTAPPRAEAGSALRPLPALVFRDGRVLFGPFPVAAIGPLY